MFKNGIGKVAVFVDRKDVLTYKIIQEEFNKGFDIIDVEPDG